MVPVSSDWASSCGGQDIKSIKMKLLFYEDALCWLPGAEKSRVIKRDQHYWGKIWEMFPWESTYAVVQSRTMYLLLAAKLGIVKATSGPGFKGMKRSWRITRFGTVTGQGRPLEKVQTQFIKVSRRKHHAEKMRLWSMKRACEGLLVKATGTVTSRSRRGQQFWRCQ